MHAYGEVDEALAAAAASDYGLQAGVFTNDVRVIDAAVERIDVGGLMINDVPTFRVDHMPYGGVKLSGFGREGVQLRDRRDDGDEARRRESPAVNGRVIQQATR